MSEDVFQLKRGTTAAVNAYLPAAGEPVYDTTLKQLRVGDGVTLGGTDSSLSNANLSALAGLTGAADRLAYFTGVGAMALTPLTAVARALLDDTTVAAQRATLGAAASGTNTDITSLSNVTLGSTSLIGTSIRSNADSTTVPSSGGTLVTPAIRLTDNAAGAKSTLAIQGYSFSTANFGSTLVGTRSNGSIGAHGAVPTGRSVLTLLGAASDGTTYNPNGRIDFYTTESQTPTASGGEVRVLTTPNGAIVPALAATFGSNGSLAVVGALSAASASLTAPLPVGSGGTGNATGLAATATALATSRSISATGDATWSVNFNGTANATAAITLANSGVGAGTYGSVTVNAKGLVTSASVATPIANGGTGSTTAAAARTALGVLELGTDYISGLQLIRVSGTALTVTSGGAYLVGASSVLQAPADIVLSGLSLTASTLYHVYLYSNAGTPAVEVVTTAPSSVYRGKARTKTGNTSRRYLGSVYVLSAGGMAPFVHDLSSGKIMYLEAAFGGPLMVVNGGQATTVTNVTSAALPSTATAVDILAVNAATTTGVLNIGATGFTAYQALAVTQRGWLSVPLNSSNQISYNYDVTPTGGAQPAAFITVCAYSFGR